MGAPEATKPPTNRQLLAWWDAQPKGPRTCTDCGRVDSSSYVQPQHPYWSGGVEGIALCGNCIGRRSDKRRADRKAQLAQRPKDCARCGARPHRWIYGSFRLCGRCLTATKREHSRAMAAAGTLGIFATGLLVDTRGWAGRVPLFEGSK